MVGVGGGGGLIQVAGDCAMQVSVHVSAQGQAQRERGFAIWKG